MRIIPVIISSQQLAYYRQSGDIDGAEGFGVCLFT